MAPSVEERIAELGKSLANTSLKKDTLLKLLKQAASSLSEVNQSPTLRSVLGPINDVLVQGTFLRHKDKDVRLLVSACFSEMMRILAPDPPYSDDVLKDIFKLFVSTFEELDETEGPYFSRRVSILETIAKMRCCVLMLDIDCEDLVLEMFQVFFAVVREDHPPSVLQNMTAIMELILEERGDISQALLDVILRNLLKDSRNVSPAARKLAISVVQHCAEKLEPFVQRFLTSVMFENKTARTDLQEDYHEIIFEIYQCAPQMLLAVIPNLTQELLTDQVDVRLKAVNLLGRLFALPGQHVAHEYHQLFSEFLKRLSDKTVEVRLAAVECAKECFLANPFGTEASEILSGLKGRLLDFDDKVRIHVVNAICDLANSNLKCVPSEVIKLVAERLRDKKLSVRKDTLQKLVEVYKAYCMKCTQGIIAPSEQFEWIPSKIIRVCYDKDCKEFRPPGMELVFAEDLFPVQLPVDERTQHWILMFSVFCSTDIKALERILSQKQRLQQEMQLYLSHRQMSKEKDSPELQRKIQKGLKTMSVCFIDPVRAEESFQKLHQMKDNNIFKALSQLLDPETTFANAHAIRDDLLKRMGERHPQHEFLKILSLKCSYMLFGTDHVKAVLRQSLANKMASNQSLLNAGIDLLLKIASFFPFLLKGSEEDLYRLFLEDDESLKDRVVQIIAKAGRFIHNQRSVDAMLEKLCIDGNRKQAKYAVSALAALTAESGLETLSLLYKQLVESINNCQNLPTVLQSLGCIAQTAIPIFETREDEVIKFIVRKLLRSDCDSVSQEGEGSLDTEIEHPSRVCQLKIYGLKTLVKSFLPHKDGHARQRIKGLLGVLTKLLQTGDISEDVKSSEVDKEHLRLAAAKSVLRLARRWEFHISPQLFHLTLLKAQDPSVHVRRRFLDKVHQCLKGHTISNKYASAFALAASDDVKDVQADAKKYLADFVDTYHREALLRQSSAPKQMEGASLTIYPEYVLTYLVHVLGHHPTFPMGSDAESKEAYEPFYRQLLFYLQALFSQDRSDSARKDDVDNLSSILAIFRAIKRAEDAVDKHFTNNLYVLCDIGIIIAKNLGHKKNSSGRIPGGIPLPSQFYKVCEGNEEKTDGSSLPHCLADRELFTRFLHAGNMSHSSQPSSPLVKRTRRNWADSSREEILHDSESCQKPNRMGVTLMTSEEQGKEDSQVDQESKSHGSKRLRSSKSRYQGESRSKEDAIESLVHERKRGRPKKAQPGTENERNQPVHGVNLMSMNSKKQQSEVEVQNQDFVGRVSPSNTIADEENRHYEDVSVDAQEFMINKSNEHWVQDEIVEAPRRSCYSRKTLQDVCQQSQSIRNRRKSEEHIKKTDEDVPSNEATEKMAKGAVQGFKTPVEDHSKSPEWKAEKDREGDETLVGKRIKLWWPVDRRFRYGNINNFDPANNTHKITYDDGEVELLQLVNERWELISGSQKDDLRCPPKGWKQKQGKLVAEAMTPEIGDITLEPLVEPGKIVEEVHEVGSPSPRKEQYPLKQASGSEHSKKDKKIQRKKSSMKEKGSKSQREAHINISDDERLVGRRTRRQKIHQ